MKIFDRMKEYRYLTDIQRIDIIWFWVLAIGTAFLYGHRTDMPLTLMHARDLITAIARGEFFDFYGIVLKKDIVADYGLPNPGMVGGANYNILLYLFLAVLMLPWVAVSKLFSLNINYYWMCQYIEAVLLFLDVVAAYQIKRLCEAYGFSREQSRRTAYLFLTSFLLLFSTVGFDQLDIIYIIFLLIALQEYAKDRDVRFALWMSFAILLKSFPLFLFIPLVLLKKKRLLSIAGYGVLGMLFSGINWLVYHKDAGYQTTKEVMEAFYHFSERLTNTQIAGNIYPVPIFLVGFLLLCILAYLSDEKKDSYKSIVFFGLTIYGLFFLFVYWHPQWACILALFITLASPLVKNKTAFFYCETALALGYFVITYINWFSTPAELFMINGGILPLLFGKLYNGTGVSVNLVKISPNIYLYANAVLTASIIAMIGMLAHSLRRSDDTVEADAPLERSLVYLRGLPLLLFNLLVIVAYFYYY